MKIPDNHLWNIMFVLMIVLLIPIGWVLIHPTSWGEVVLISAIGGGDAVLIDVMWRHKP